MDEDLLQEVNDNWDTIMEESKYNEANCPIKLILIKSIKDEIKIPRLDQLKWFQHSINRMPENIANMLLGDPFDQAIFLY